jgi:hypothetical protein
MAGGFPTAYANGLLDAVLSGGYLALYTTAPSDSSAGTEVSASGYARQAISAAAASGRAATNSALITFGPAGANWGTITAVSVMSASSGGTMKWWATLTASKTVTTGETLTIAAGDLDLAIAAS